MLAASADVEAARVVLTVLDGIGEPFADGSLDIRKRLPGKPASARKFDDIATRLADGSARLRIPSSIRLERFL